MVANINPVTLPSNSALAPFLRVNLSASFIVASGATEQEVGTLVSRVQATDTVAPIVTANAEGAVWMVASGAISAWATVYGASAGKVSDSSNAHAIGTTMDAAAGDGAHIRVIRGLFLDQDQVAAIDGNIVFDDDFLDNYPAAQTALDAVGGTAWVKTETNGLGVIETSAHGGVLTFSFDAVAEAATADLYMASIPFDIDANLIVEFRLGIFDIGDNVALDINFGMADGTHATDFDQIAAYAAFHLNGASLLCLAHSDDGTIDTAEVTTGITLVDNAYNNFKIDFSDTASVKFYINDVRVASGTAFDMSAFTGLLTPIVHIEKTGNNTTADVRVDRIRVQSQRS